MDIISLLLLAVGLSMDAFAVSICKGLAMRELKLRHMLIIGTWFGGFQALMPLLGWLLGWRFQAAIERADHWIAFVLLAILGTRMVWESRKEEECADGSFSCRAMLPMALATSIDALAVGVTFAFLQVNIIPAVSLIGSATFLLSALGVRRGCVFGRRYRAAAEALGGAILILMGLKILLEHLGVFP